MLPSTTRESKGSHIHPKSNTKIHLFARKSKIHCKVKSTSNVQHYNPLPLVLLVNSYQLIFPRCTPNVHLIPSGNANDQNKYIRDLLSLLHSPSRIQSPLPCNHSPSKFCQHHYPRKSILWKGFLASEDITTKAYLCSHHTGHSMLMEINRHYWVPVSQNGPTLEYFTNMMLHVPISFVVAANSCSQFQSPNWAFHAFMYQTHNLHQF